MSADSRRRELLSSIEAKKTTQNQYSEKISQAKDGAERAKMIDKMKAVKADMQKEEEELREVMKNWQTLMLQVPNVPDVSVPDGNSDADNKEIKVWGEKPTFDFEPKDHVEIMTALGMADFERGVKVHGFRGYFLMGAGAELSFAIWNYALQFFSKKGFVLSFHLPLCARIIFTALAIFLAMSRIFT